jgi:long-chain acyl-CoA synthetase
MSWSRPRLAPGRLARVGIQFASQHARQKEGCVGIPIEFTIAGMLRSNASERPDAAMLVDREARFTWSEHYRRACRVGNALASEGQKTGSRVAFLDRNSAAYFEILFGCALSGAVNVSVNWRLSPDEMAAVIDDSAAVVLVVHRDYLECLGAMSSGLSTVKRILVFDDSPGAELPPEIPGHYRNRALGYEDWIADQHEDDPGHVPGAEEVALQLYTSGTTGLPKGVMLSNRNLATAIGAADQSFHIDEKVVSLVAMPLFHIGGSGWALCGMSRGGTSVILRDVDPSKLLALVEAERVTHTFVVPAVLMFLLATPSISATDTSSLREIYYGASPIAEDVLVSCLRVFHCNFTQLYGMTETTGAFCALLPEDHDPDGPRRHLLRSAGKPLAGVELRIADPETGADLPPMAVGEILTRSSYTMLGYWRKPEESAAAFYAGKWLRTGDAGYVDDEGYLFLHDRIKDMIVTGGENVYPAEVENILLSHPGVADAGVIGVPDDRWGETVKAIVVLAGPNEGSDVESPTPVDESEIIAYCREHLAHYKCPTSVDFVATLPRNPSGKILKRELRAPYWHDSTRGIH